ncbi:MAG: alpha-mannosidase [Planctomycetes bacterium]|nr:alpha-mannosidase [Planctomycetota bacterium]
MLAHHGYTRQRIQKLAERLWAQVYPQTRPVDAILVSPPGDRVPYDQAQSLEYAPAKLGQEFGPLWATHWFRISATVPKEWVGKRVDLRWDSRSEATLWVAGKTLQGLNSESGWGKGATRREATLLKRAAGGERIDCQVEMACNRLFGGGGSDHDQSTPPFILDQCSLVVFDPEAWELYFDYHVLVDLENEQTKDLDKTWGGELMYELNRFANTCQPEDRSTWPAGREILKKLYTRTNGTVVHELSAIGHAHIDTAWLWPIGETWRKCMRTFSSALAYMDEYGDYRFSCSQAAQFEAMKRMNPDLYARMKAKVAAKQFIPVGGSWVEPDCNLPSGEALARQFLYGQRFFKQEFGAICREFWNPDVFGYNGQLPQLMRLSGITRFLTQKLSWNYFNKPKHHTFTWQGIDGSEVLAHFPPADTYNAEATVSQLRDNARNYKDNDRSRHSLMLFGYGDGGGGPQRRMIEVLRRAQDLQGLPRTQMRTSDEFFELLERDCTDRPVMVGELYFEFHRGTYTSQAATKRGNRLGELALHDAEFLSAVAARLGRGAYPTAELDRLWKLLLVNQFHDILPGSSITLVYEDTHRDHADIQASAALMREVGIAGVMGHSVSDPAHLFVPVNTIGFDRHEVAVKPDGSIAYVEAPSYGLGKATRCEDHVAVTKLPAGGYRLENVHLRADLGSDGTLRSLVEKSSGREALSGPGNVLELYDDHPTSYDAWDVDPFHLETRRACPPATSCTVAEQSIPVGSAHGREGALRVQVTFERAIGKASRMKQVVSLSANARRLDFHTEMDWHESHTFLKVAFPVNVRAMNATYEMQFGCVERPTHVNTPYDLAQYEVPGHRWADLSEHGFGVALLSDCKYGFSTAGDTMRLSLLRAPKHPDPQADMGRHVFSYALMPHALGWREAGVVAEASRFNAPIRWGKDGKDQHWVSYFATEDHRAGSHNLVLDTVKKAEDSTALVVRLYECHGARGTAKLRSALPITRARFADILEEGTQAAVVHDGVVEIPYTPFQIITVVLE